MSVPHLKKFEFKKGNKHPDWKGGRIKSKNGYIWIYLPTHPFIGYCKCYVAEHRLVMEQHLGRYLTPEEVVHHENGIRDDNRIENLNLFENSGKHIAEHNSKRIWKEESKEKHRVKATNMIRNKLGRFVRKRNQTI